MWFTNNIPITIFIVVAVGVMKVKVVSLTDLFLPKFVVKTHFALTLNYITRQFHKI